MKKSSTLKFTMNISLVSSICIHSSIIFIFIGKKVCLWNFFPWNIFFPQFSSFISTRILVCAMNSRLCENNNTKGDDDDNDDDNSNSNGGDDANDYDNNNSNGDDDDNNDENNNNNGGDDDSHKNNNKTSNTTTPPPPSTTTTKYTHGDHSLKQEDSRWVFPEDSFSWGTFSWVVVCWLLNVPATCECISGTDLLRQFYAQPH